MQAILQTRFLALLVPVLVAAAPALGARQVGAGDEMPSPKLPKSDLADLNNRLRKWYEEALAAVAIGNASVDRKLSAKQRSSIAKHRKRASKNKAKFREAFKKKGSKVGTLLKHVPDLLAIADGCFKYPKQSNGGIVKLMSIDKRKKLGYAVRFPKGYKPDKKNWPLVYCLPPRAKGGKKWVSAKDYIGRVWPKTAEEVFTGYVVVCPDLPGDMDLAAEYDVTNATEEAEGFEHERRVWCLRILGDVFLNFRIDTDRVVLDACKESTPFAGRLVSTFPDRFAGLLLRSPQGTEGIVADNLGQVSVGLVSDAASKEQARALGERLEKVGHEPELSTEGKGEIPFAGQAEALLPFLASARRNLFAKHIVIAPATDRFRKAYWAEITQASYLTEVPLEQRPRIEIKADREENRIEIQARNVTEVRLYLNDLIVDLDQPIQVFLNGTVREDKRSRMRSLVFNTRSGLIVARNDPRCIFVSKATYTIPAPVKDGAGENGGDGGPGK